ncbi:unnamed protein product [Didymodactylos carnosus]|uniref:B box-type domain-containing protein n=1 Tax=Didymodactylos carnosus TaxID=1234261 RepID=A0A8S2E659_9BILA|nr:unnamed protein product [Didymodactylos carnosus]CAF3943071.1 unnamed protein product [Didymodactylos carnosus]
MATIWRSYDSMYKMPTRYDNGYYSRQHYLYDPKYTFLASKPSIYSSAGINTAVNRNRASSTTRTSAPRPHSSYSSSKQPLNSTRSSLDIMSAPPTSSPPNRCDDCSANDGLFQCCHCNQRLCIRCCNKHYKSMTVELERLHDMSERLIQKIYQTKNDLERQKNETIEQCHKWKCDTINTVNKAHALIIQTIYDEYEQLGKEYETYAQNEMKLIKVNKYELNRMRKGDLGLISNDNDSSGDGDETNINPIEIIRNRIETLAKHIDETGTLHFEVKLPKFDIDDTLRVESSFGDSTRTTSATWNNCGNEDTTNQQITLFPEQTKVDVTNEEADIISHVPSSRYALSVENDIELQQQQYYKPTSQLSCRNERFDSAYGTAPPSPTSSTNDKPSCSSLSLHDTNNNLEETLDFGLINKFSDPLKRLSTTNDTFFNNRRHTHTYDSTSTDDQQEQQQSNNSDNDDTYHCIQHVQLKHDDWGGVEGVAVQAERSTSTTNDGNIERKRTTFEACGVRRRTTMFPSASSNSTTHESSTLQQPSWLHYRTTSTPSFIH